MKACVLHAAGDLRCEEVAKPQPKQGEVLVHIMASGICGSDIPRVLTKGTYHFPTIPGHEFAGIVEETGREPTRHGFINMSRCFRCYLVFPVLRAGPAIMRNVKATAISVPAVTGASASISRFPFGTSLRCQKTFLLNRPLCASRLPSLTMRWQWRRCGRVTMSW